MCNRYFSLYLPVMHQDTSAVMFQVLQYHKQQGWSSLHLVSSTLSNITLSKTCMHFLIQNHFEGNLTAFTANLMAFLVSMSKYVVCSVVGRAYKISIPCWWDHILFTTHCFGITPLAQHISSLYSCYPLWCNATIQRDREF